MIKQQILQKHLQTEIASFESMIKNMSEFRTKLNHTFYEFIGVNGINQFQLLEEHRKDIEFTLRETNKFESKIKTLKSYLKNSNKTRKLITN